jgi:hypothetical protein
MAMRHQHGFLRKGPVVIVVIRLEERGRRDPVHVHNSEGFLAARHSHPPVPDQAQHKHHVADDALDRETAGEELFGQPPPFELQPDGEW